MHSYSTTYHTRQPTGSDVLRFILRFRQPAVVVVQRVHGCTPGRLFHSHRALQAQHEACNRRDVEHTSARQPRCHGFPRKSSRQEEGTQQTKHGDGVGALVGVVWQAAEAVADGVVPSAACVSSQLVGNKYGHDLASPSRMSMVG